MATTGARLLVDCLLAQGVTTAFGVPGESYLAVLDALHDAPAIRLVPNRQEGGAAFMAAAWGKLTGAPGICFVTRGPGATNAAIGVHTARQDSSPMILFVGQVATGDARARGVPGGRLPRRLRPARQVGDRDRRPRPRPRDRRPRLRRRLTGRPGPVVVALPEDMLTAPTDARPGPRVRVPKSRRHPGGPGRDRPPPRRRRAPAGHRLGRRLGRRRAARAARLRRGNRLPVLVGFRCQDLLDNASPSYAGDAGLGKTPAVKALMREADLILAVGVRFGEILTDGYSSGLPRMAATLIHAHASDAELNKIDTADLPVHAHPDHLMPALAELRLDGAAAGPPAPTAAHAAWAASLATPPQPGALDMGEVVRHLQGVLPEDAILTNGAGNFAIWTNKHFPFRGRQRLLAPQSGAMGYGVPAAIAAKLAHPERTVVALAGDGDFQMTGQELGCALQTGAWPIVLVVNNAQLRHHPHAPGAELPGPGQLHRDRQPRLRRARPRLRRPRRARDPDRRLPRRLRARAGEPDRRRARARRRRPRA